MNCFLKARNAREGLLPESTHVYKRACRFQQGWCWGNSQTSYPRSIHFPTSNSLSLNVSFSLLLCFHATRHLLESQRKLYCLQGAFLFPLVHRRELVFTRICCFFSRYGKWEVPPPAFPLTLQSDFLDPKNNVSFVWPLPRSMQMSSVAEIPNLGTETTAQTMVKCHLYDKIVWINKAITWKYESSSVSNKFKNFWLLGFI